MMSFISRIFLTLVYLLINLIAQTTIAVDDPTSDPPPPKVSTLISLDDALTYSADKQSPVRVEATLALGDVAVKDGHANLEAIDLLLQHLRPGGDELVEAAAGISLRKIGQHALPTIRNLLDSDKLSDQATACNAIKAAGLDADELLSRLKQMLVSGETSLQRAALFALQGFDDRAFELLPEVAECLESHDFNVQCMACRVLEKYGSEAIVGEKSLVQILETGNPSSRGWAAIVLGAIGPTDDNDIVPMLMARLTESRAQVEKQRILIGLAYLGREAKRAIPVVTEFLDKRSHHVGSHAAYALFRITGDEHVLIKTLTEALKDRNYKYDAFEIVNRLGAEASMLKPELVTHLGSDEEDIREQAVLALGRLGADASDAVPWIKKLLLDSDALVREAASQTINAINKAVTEASPDEEKE